jgi:hypothetical protein
MAYRKSSTVGLGLPSNQKRMEGETYAWWQYNAKEETTTKKTSQWVIRQVAKQVYGMLLKDKRYFKQKFNLQNHVLEDHALATAMTAVIMQAYNILQSHPVVTKSDLATNSVYSKYLQEEAMRRAVRLGLFETTNYHGDRVWKEARKK